MRKSGAIKIAPLFLCTMKKFLLKIYYSFLSLYDRGRYKTKIFLRSIKVWFSGFFVDKKPDYDKISKCKRLVVCAHPDDETIFFFSVLRKDTYVVCLSNCGEKTRRREFFRAIDDLKIHGVMFNAPDIKNAQWMWSKFFLKRRFEKIKNVLREDCEIYTHSIIGESGHPHHYAVGKFIKGYFKDFKVSYTAEKAEYANELTEDFLEKKTYIMTNIYSSQIKMLTRWCPWYDGYMKRDSFLK